MDQFADYLFYFDDPLADYKIPILNDLIDWNIWQQHIHEVVISYWFCESVSKIASSGCSFMKDKYAKRSHRQRHKSQIDEIVRSKLLWNSITDFNVPKIRLQAVALVLFIVFSICIAPLSNNVPIGTTPFLKFVCAIAIGFHVWNTKALCSTSISFGQFFAIDQILHCLIYLLILCGASASCLVGLLFLDTFTSLVVNIRMFFLLFPNLFSWIPISDLCVIFVFVLCKIAWFQYLTFKTLVETFHGKKSSNSDWPYTSDSGNWMNALFSLVLVCVNVFNVFWFFVSVKPVIFELADSWNKSEKAGGNDSNDKKPDFKSDKPVPELKILAMPLPTFQVMSPEMSPVITSSLYADNDNPSDAESYVSS